MSENDSAHDLISNLAHEFAERFRQGERPALDEYTERYPDLATQIRELFPALVVMEQFGSVAGEPARPAADAAIPKQLGEYRILREIGRGGMGIVYEAVQESLGRHVALKVLPLHQLLTQTHRERFEREAKAAARLHHTNIVPVYGIGMHEGIHYYAMQYIQGQALDKALQEVRRLRNGSVTATVQPPTVYDAGGLVAGAQVEESSGTRAPATTSANRLQSAHSTASANSNGHSDLTGSSSTRYFVGVAKVGIQVAEALAYAHSMGMVHRDIKPSNLLLDSQGITWITDFGLVKDEGGGDLTTPGDIVGIIRYMAPERLDNQGDGRSDIYGLGATLFEMLTLRPAFPGEKRLELMDRVRHVEPRRPRQIDPRIPRDLETVVLKAMAKEPARRYQTAGQMAEDLRRFLADRPVLARRSTTAERAWRWCRRNPVVAILTASVVTLLLVLLIGARISNARLQKQLNRAEKAEGEKTDKLWDSLLAGARASRWSGRPGRRFEGLEAVRQAAAIRSDLRLRNEAIALLTLPDVRIAQELPQGFPTGSASLAFDSDFRHYARSDLKGDISIRRVADDQEVKLLPGPGKHAYGMKFSTNGRYLSAWYVGSGLLWDWREARVVLRDASKTFSPDGAHFASMQPDGWLAIYELPSAQIVKRIQIGPPTQRWPWYDYAFDPNGKRLAVATSQPAELKVVDLETATVTRTLTWTEGALLTWQSGDTRLVEIGGQQMKVWDTRTWKPQVVLNTPDDLTNNASFSPRDELLASSGWQKRLQIWNPTTGRELFGLPGAPLPVQFNRDGSRLAATILGTKLQIWEVAGCQVVRILRCPHETQGGTWQIHFSPNGTLLATTGGGGARIWDAYTGQDVADLPTGICSGAVFAPDGKALFTRTAAGLERWPIHVGTNNIAIGERQQVAPLEWVADHGTFASETLVPAGSKLAANLRTEGVVLLLDPQHPNQAVRLPGLAGSRNIAFSANEHWAAVTTWWNPPDKLPIADVQSRTVVWTYPVNTEGAFSPDSRWLVTGGDACRIWKTGAWQSEPERIIESPPGLGRVNHAVFAPDGIMLAIAYEARVVRLVNVQTGQELGTLPAPDFFAVDHLCFSPDGSRLACKMEQGVQLWDLRHIRAQLADMGLDWDMPPYPPEAPRSPVNIRVLH
jgi:serine/threonine protein kinase/WD40 repeat protein